jgi:hypothetical protein
MRVCLKSRGSCHLRTAAVATLLLLAASSCSAFRTPLSTASKAAALKAATRLRCAARATRPQPQCGLFDFLAPKDVGDTGVNRFREVQRVEQPELPFPQEILTGTFLEGRLLACVYDGDRDGWSARAFHEKCDLQGPCVLLAQTMEGAWFGAFNPDGWVGDDDYRASQNAFLFCFPAAMGGEAWVKCEKVGGGDGSVFDYARSGPHFGADGLIIGQSQAAVTGLFAGPDMADVSTAQGELRQATSRLGQSYARLPPESGQTSLLGGNAQAATLNWMQVWAAPELSAAQ